MKSDEKVMLVIRLHWLVLALPALVAVAGIAAGVWFGGYTYIVTAAALGFLAYRIIERRNNLWAVTNLRVIDEFGVFSLNSKESPLEKINNVTCQQSLWGRMFGFGNVQIQTAAETGATTYAMVEKPEKLRDMITLMQEEYKKTQITLQARELAKAIAMGAPGQARTDIASELEKLHDLKQRGILTEVEYLAAKRKILGG